MIKAHSTTQSEGIDSSAGRKEIERSQGKSDVPEKLEMNYPSIDKIIASRELEEP